MKRVFALIALTLGLIAVPAVASANNQDGDHHPICQEYSSYSDRDWDDDCDYDTVPDDTSPDTTAPDETTVPQDTTPITTSPPADTTVPVTPAPTTQAPPDTTPASVTIVTPTTAQVVTTVATDTPPVPATTVVRSLPNTGSRNTNGLVAIAIVLTLIGALSLALNRHLR